MVTPSVVPPVSSVTTALEAASGDGAGETQRERLKKAETSTLTMLHTACL